MNMRKIMDLLETASTMETETIEEAKKTYVYQVVATNKDGEVFRSGKFTSKKEANDKHWEMAKNKKYKSIKVEKIEE